MRPALRTLSKTLVIWSTSAPAPLQLHSQRLGHRVHVLVAASRQIDQDNLVGGQASRDLGRLPDSVGGLESWNDSFGLAQEAKPGQRLVVGDADIGRATGVLQEAVLRPDAGIVEPSRDAVGLDDL